MLPTAAVVPNRIVIDLQSTLKQETLAQWLGGTATRLRNRFRTPLDPDPFFPVSFSPYCPVTFNITVHRQAILLLVVESGTRKFSCLSVESGTYDVICQFRTVKGMVAESEVLKAQNCALSKFSLPMHSNERPH